MSDQFRAGDRVLLIKEGIPNAPHPGTPGVVVVGSVFGVQPLVQFDNGVMMRCSPGWISRQ